MICLSAVVASSSSEQIVDDVFFSFLLHFICRALLCAVLCYVQCSHTHTHTQHMNISKAVVLILLLLLLPAASVDCYTTTTTAAINRPTNVNGGAQSQPSLA